MSGVLLTGADGFVGKLLKQRLSAMGTHLNVATRRQKLKDDGPHTRCHQIDSIGSNTDWGPALEGCATVIHLAAQVPSPEVSADVYGEVNALGTGRLVEQATDHGVRKFIYLSSIFAVVENSSPNVVNDETPTMSTTPYGRSKRDAERYVERFAGAGRIGITLRPPVVYGGAVGGNWHRLQRLSMSGVPLPFRIVRNKRTMIAVDNLVDAITHLLVRTNNDLVSGTFAVSDNQALSIAQTIRLLRQGMGIAPRLVPVPVTVLRALGHMAGRQREVESLIGSLQIDSQRFQETFDWRPAVSAEDAIRQSGMDFAARSAERPN